MAYRYLEEEINHIENQRWQDFQQWESYYIDEYTNRSKSFLHNKLIELEGISAPTDKECAEKEAIEQLLKDK